MRRRTWRRHRRWVGWRCRGRRRRMPKSPTTGSSTDRTVTTRGWWSTTGSLRRPLPLLSSTRAAGCSGCRRRSSTKRSSKLSTWPTPTVNLPRSGQSGRSPCQTRRRSPRSTRQPATARRSCRGPQATTAGRRSAPPRSKSPPLMDKRCRPIPGRAMSTTRLSVSSGPCRWRA